MYINKLITNSKHVYIHIIIGLLLFIRLYASVSDCGVVVSVGSVHLVARVRFPLPATKFGRSLSPRKAIATQRVVVLNYICTVNELYFFRTICM